MQKKSLNLVTIKRVTVFTVTALFVATLGIEIYLLDTSHDELIEDLEQEKYALIEGMANTLASDINGTDYKQLKEDVPREKILSNNHENAIYKKINQKLLKAKNQHVNRFGESLEMFTLNFDRVGTEPVVTFGVNMGSYPYFRREFTWYSADYFNSFKNGATVPPYQVEDESFIGAYAPIADDNGKTIGFVLIQTKYQPLKDAAQLAWNDLLTSYIIFTSILLLVLSVFVLVVLRFSNREQEIASTNTAKLTNTFNIIEEFVENVKKGDYKTTLNFGEYKADNLARSLDVLHKKLADNAQNSEDRNWIAEGRLQIASILRIQNEFEQLSQEVIESLVKYVNAIQGAFYITEGEGKDMTINMIAKHAYNRKKYDMTSFKLGQGLVGQCAFEMDTIYRTEIPDDYWSITSGILGDRKPVSILLVPLITDEKLYGIVELTSLHEMEANEIKFVEELSDIIARTIFNLKTSIRTQELLEESLEKGKVLEQQQNELQRQQGELELSNTKLQEQIEEVNRSQRKMHSLLENSSEIITIYNEDGTVAYESPSVTNILGYDADELVGTKDFDRVTEGEDAIRNMFSTLLDTPEESPVIQFNYERKDGSRVWMEAVGKNLIDDPAIGGIVFNSRDITERRQAEREQIMRGRMQALSENSPDIIIRFSLTGDFLYTNPSLGAYTHLDTANFKDKNMSDVGLQEKILEGWQAIIDEVKASEQNVSQEMDFPTSEGDLIMQVNAIPEFDDTGKLDTVLMVSHDITERKKQEILIQQANKKITDSINYAKRIQNSIIPDNEIIQEYFSDSFIYYKPKDVVSGDFPWFYQRGDDLYYAAVDCTGHGVPGAMMSLIGYFLLNEITGHPQAYDPAVILNKLHEGVRTTLRQDREGAQARDGMDVALCRINLKNRTLEYSGAHRPLYLVRDGELIQYKGTRKAIGGTSSRGEKEFTFHTIELLEGDAVYFFSDGLPDQFGGERGLKYSPKRIRELCVEHADKKMQDVRTIFDTDFEAWRGGGRQIDDVLLIGIRF